MKLEEMVKREVAEILEEKGTISLKWIRANARKIDFNVEEFMQVYPGVESLTLENGVIVEVKQVPKAEPKKVVVSGNTYSVKGVLKQYGFKWDADKKAWFGNEEQQAAMINGLPKTFKSPCEDEIKALKFEVVE